MTVKHLDHLNLTVHNFADTADWYKRVFGFEVVEEGNHSGEHWGVLRSGDALLCIYEHPEFKQSPDMDKAKLHSIHHFGLRITDRQRWESTVTKEKLEVGYGGAISYPHSTSWYICDPSGYTIEVAYWHNDQIAFRA